MQDTGGCERVGADGAKAGQWIAQSPAAHCNHCFKIPNGAIRFHFFFIDRAFGHFLSDRDNQKRTLSFARRKIDIARPAVNFYVQKRKSRQVQLAANFPRETRSTFLVGVLVVPIKGLSLRFIEKNETSSRSAGLRKTILGAEEEPNKAPTRPKIVLWS